MKKTIFYILLMTIIFVMSCPSNAQINKGRMLLAGSTSFSTVSVKTEYGVNYSDPSKSKTKSLELTPELGIFIANNLAMGLAIRYKHEEMEFGYQTFTSSSLFAIPFIKAYFGKQNFKPFVYGGIGFGRSNDDQSGYGTSFTNYEKKLGIYEIGGGFALFVTRNVSLEFGAAYSHITSKYLNSGNVDMIDSSNGIGFIIGINLCL